MSSRRMSRKKRVQITVATIGVVTGTALVLFFPRIKKMLQQPSMTVGFKGHKSRNAAGRQVVRFDFT